MPAIETDYLLIGCGAVSMAFADTLLAETDAHITIVDRHGKPGGHWNDAYSFVTLHQPSSYYGVNSLPLGSGRKDTHGHNSGLYELASGPEVSGYYDAVMRQNFLPSGRVGYFPMSEYRADGTMISLLSGVETKIIVRRKTVDTTASSPAVPSTHKRKFDVASEVRIVAPNELTRMWLPDVQRPSRYVVLGAGKTAIDVVTWLLATGCTPETISWVRPRDAWLFNRIKAQPGIEFFDEVFGAQAAQMQAFSEAVSVDDIFLRLEAADIVVRVDPDVTPTMFHYATVSKGEVDELRRVRDVVRMGRVRAITRDTIELDKGSIPASTDALYIDCTASAVERRPYQPIFQGNRIVPQLVRMPQPSFSAALVAYVEAHYGDDAEKNGLCQTVPFPHDLSEYPRTNIINMMNQGSWTRDERLSGWIRGSRLDGFGKVIAAIDRQDSAKVETIERMRSYGAAAMRNLTRLAAAT